MRPRTGSSGVIEPVYAELDLDWDPRTVGSILDEAPGVSVDEVSHALLGVYADRYDLVPGAVTDAELAAGADLLGRHRVAV